MDRPAKIGDFEISSHVDQKVLRLYVSVDDLLGVTVVESISQLSHIL